MAIILRIPNLYNLDKSAANNNAHLKGPVSREPKIVVSDRTYILGDNVRYIDYDHNNKGRLLIHYTNYATEELYNHKNTNETKKIYDMIIEALRQNETFIEYNEDQ